MSEVPQKPIDIKIRWATPYDTVNFAKFVQKTAIGEMGYMTMGSVDEGNLVYYCGKLIQVGKVVIAEVSGRIVGVLAMDKGTEPWAPAGQYFLNLEWFLVLEKFRERGTAAKLLEWLEGFADENSVPIHFGLYNSDENTKVLEMFMKRKGFTYMGANFQRMPSSGKQEEFIEE